MPFIKALAGPSRLPYRAATQAAASAAAAVQTSASRKYASTSTQTTAPAPGVGSDVDTAAALDKNSKQAKTREKEMWASHVGYNMWLNGDARQYDVVNQGQKAKWLGGDVPYATNPSFRPGPPLSNDLQNLIYADLRQNKRTVGQLAEHYNVSKARIQAIKKLKEVEMEFRKQGLPLQQAFHNAMEPLLGVQPLLNAKTRKVEEQLLRFDAEARQASRATGIEREEEQRLDAGIGGKGAFGVKGVRTDVKEGLERVVFEFRDEEAVLAEREAEAQAKAGVRRGGEAAKLVAEQAAAPETPEHERASHVEVNTPSQAASPSISVQPGSAKTPYRFIDISKQPKNPTNRRAWR